MSGQRFFRHGELPLAILALLDTKPMHGYQILAELDRLFGDEYEPSTGTVYPAITALRQEGLITSRRDARRNVFSLADSGRKALEQRGEMLAELEMRTGKRLRANGSIDSILSDFGARARAISKRIKPGKEEAALKKLEQVLAKSISELEKIAGGDR